METIAAIVGNRNAVLSGAGGVGLAKLPGARPGLSVVMDQETEVEETFMKAVRDEVTFVCDRHFADWLSQTVRGYHLDTIINSFFDVVDLLQHPEANLRIYAVELAARYGPFASEKGQTQLREGLGRLLGDNAQNSCMYSGLDCDAEEKVDTVARMARRALRCLDCAASPQETP